MGIGRIKDEIQINMMANKILRDKKKGNKEGKKNKEK